MNIPNVADVLIVGGGPAGLAAANACVARGLTTLLVDRGKTAPERNRRDPVEVADGIGGAGLFSDGKFSFFPSATQLWDLKPRSVLKEAYDWTGRTIAPFGIETPPFPTNGSEGASEPTNFETKVYPSFRMQFDARMQLIARLAAGAGALVTCADVVRMSTSKEGVEAIVCHGESHAECRVVAKAAIIATGRLGAVRLLRWLPNNPVFRRLEVGVRIEQRRDSFFLKDARTLDPKLIAVETAGIEWRTFCCCKGGEVVQVLSNGILAVAGRSDGSSMTERSNIAFHVRITDPTIGGPMCTSMLTQVERVTAPLVLELTDIDSMSQLETALAPMFGTVIDLPPIFSPRIMRLSPGLGSPTLHL